MYDPCVRPGNIIVFKYKNTYCNTDFFPWPQTYKKGFAVSNKVQIFEFLNSLF